MKRKISTLFSNKAAKRRNIGQCVAAGVIAFTFAVTGAAGYLPTLTRTQALLVEPGAVAQEEKDLSAPDGAAEDGIQENSAPENSVPESSAPESDTAEDCAAQPAVEEPAAPAETETVESAAPEAAAPEAAPAPETDGTAEPAESVALAEENSLPGAQEAENTAGGSPWHEMTPELAAEDPLAARYEATALTELAPDENGMLAVTPEQLDAMLDAQCIDIGEENGLGWLFDFLFGWLFGSDEAEPAPAPVYSGWQTIDGKTYYYSQETNQPLTGLHTIDNKIHYFDASGVMQENVTFGIDVSRYQQSVDWAQVKAAGASYAIIRIGYRGYGSGVLVQDPMFESHYAGATAAGLRVGVYAFSQAINEAEAREEALACLYVLNGRPLDYPIYFDSEYSTSAHTGRADSLSKEARTACALAFCDEIAKSGGGSYRPGVYASTSWFHNHLELSALSGISLWNAHYGISGPSIACEMWQGSYTGKLSGVSSSTVDLNISYIG